jgi:hypothetical protein
MLKRFRDDRDARIHDLLPLVWLATAVKAVVEPAVPASDTAGYVDIGR